MKKRLFSILIVLVMVMCLAPTTVFAQTYTCKNHVIPRTVGENKQKYTYANDKQHNVIHDETILFTYCGATIAQEDHTGGTATCTSKAVCDKCHAEYGDYKHSGELKWVDLGNGTHQQQWSCCSTPVGDAEAHDWANAEGKCTKCQTTHIHSGGKATCASGAICETCEYEYTDADPTNHTGKLEWVIDNDTHELKYNCCNKEVISKANHTGGIAT